MKVSIAMVFVSVMGALASLTPVSSFGQTNVPNSAILKVTAYVNDLVMEFNKKKSLQFRFGGDFRDIPEDLAKSLLVSFPEHRFYSPVLYYSHYAEYPAGLVIVTDAKSGKVLAYCGDIFVLGCEGSKPFFDILSSYKATSRDDAIEKVTVLSKLIVFPDWQVKRVYMKKRMIFAELDTGGKDPWRILQVSLNKENQFGRFAIVNPKEKEK